MSTTADVAIPAGELSGCLAAHRFVPAPTIRRGNRKAVRGKRQPVRLDATAGLLGLWPAANFRPAAPGVGAVLGLSTLGSAEPPIEAFVATARFAGAGLVNENLCHDLDPEGSPSSGLLRARMLPALANAPGMPCWCHTA